MDMGYWKHNECEIERELRWRRIRWHSSNHGWREAGGFPLCDLRGALHHPPYPYHSCQLQQVGETHLTCILLFPKERLTWPLRPASVIDVLYLPAECIFLFLHKEFCIDVFCIYGIKWKKVTPPPLLLLLTQSENTQPSIKYAKPASELSERDK